MILGAYYRLSFKSLKIRIFAAAWCMTCFVLVSAYSSVLFSFVMLLHAEPIINSLSDIPNNPAGVKLIMEQGGTLQMQLLVRLYLHSNQV